MIFLFLSIFVIILLVIALPTLSGIATYKYQIQPKSFKKEERPTNQYQGYIPPDELKKLQEEEKQKNSKISKLKNIKISKENIPLKFKLSEDTNNRSIRRRKVQTLEEIADPSTFDFDIDEFNNDSDDEYERKAQEKQYNEIAQNKEAYLDEIA